MPTGRTLYPDRKTSPRGTVYLLHAERPVGNARHYLGFTTDLADRLLHHINNQGSALVAEWNRLGINWELARVWEDVTMRHEYKLKNWGKASRLCPICRAAEGITGKMVRLRGKNGHFLGSRRA